MAITAAMVKELREMTGAGMMDCKKALTSYRRRYGQRQWSSFARKDLQRQQKKAGRIAAEGIVC